MAMTPKHARFCAEYLVDLNATKAAVRAGYSKNGANVTASQIMKRPEVKAEIERLQQERMARVERTQDDVLRELWKIAQQDDVTEATKVRALELYGKHLGMFVEKHEHDVKVTSLTPEQRAARVAELLKKGGATS
jgi:phage terminase small subunit